MLRANISFADIITLTTGYQMKGVITKQTDDYVKIRLEGGEMKFSMDKVESIEKQSDIENLKLLKKSHVNPSKNNPVAKTTALKKPKKEQKISSGKKVAIEDYLVDGYVVIFDFYADWCGPCKSIAPRLEKIINKYDDVILRKIDIVNWESEVVKQYNIRSVPNIWVFDKKGKKTGSPTHDINTVEKYVEKAR
jgi:thioredoxin 1